MQLEEAFVRAVQARDYVITVEVAGRAPLILSRLGRRTGELADVLALGLGLAFYPLASLLGSGFDILISGVAAGTVAFLVHKWREAS